MIIFPFWLFISEKYRVNTDTVIYSKWVAFRSLATIFIGMLLAFTLVWMPLDFDTKAKVVVSGIILGGMYIIFELIMQVVFDGIKEKEANK